VKRRQFDIIQLYTTRPREFFLFRKLSFFFEAVFNLENPLLAGFGTFEDADNRADCNYQYHHPLAVELIHGRLINSSFM
jgi:hypothetical protein